MGDYGEMVLNVNRWMDVLAKKAPIATITIIRTCEPVVIESVFEVFVAPAAVAAALLESEFVVDVEVEVADEVVDVDVLVVLSAVPRSGWRT